MNKFNQILEVAIEDLKKELAACEKHKEPLELTFEDGIIILDLLKESRKLFMKRSQVPEFKNALEIESNNHRFIYSGRVNDKHTYIVACEKTGGDFNTVVWDSGKVQRNLCVCCKEFIK